MSEGNGKRIIRVVAAEIADGQGRYLITQRNPHAVLPLLWEFPGGRVRQGESEADALRRTLKDNLGVSIEVGPRRLQVERDYQTYRLQLQSFSARVDKGKLDRHDVWDYRWVSPSEFKRYRFPPADKATVDALLGLEEDRQTEEPG